MNVAVLECEHIGVDGQPGPGDYTRLFEDLLKRSRDAEDYHLVPVDARGGLPESVHEYDAYLITGSYAGVYDQEPWIEALLQFVREAHAGSKPLVGICFGHQVIAHALGGRAEKAKVGWQLGVVSTKILAGGGRVAAGGRVAVGDRAGDGDLAGDRDRAGDGHLTGGRDRAGDGAGKGERAESGDVV
ncbi:MAG: glutamine amidotransferase-related protein, partial [Spirochaetia bacterium]